MNHIYCQPTSERACSPDPAVQWAWPSAWFAVSDHLPVAPVYGNVAPYLTPEQEGGVRSDRGEMLQQWTL